MQLLQYDPLQFNLTQKIFYIYYLYWFIPPSHTFRSNTKRRNERTLQLQRHCQEIHMSCLINQNESRSVYPCHIRSRTLLYVQRLNHVLLLDWKVFVSSQPSWSSLFLCSSCPVQWRCDEDLPVSPAEISHSTPLTSLDISPAFVSDWCYDG